MSQTWSDIRSGVRMLLRYPTLSIGAVVTLGLGIGLSTTAFCLVNATLFKGLPFPAAHRVAALVATNPAQNQARGQVSVQDLVVIEERQASFERIGAYSFAPVNLSTADGRPERFSGGQLTVEAFEALGVPPIVGRGLRAGDDRPGAERVILLGHALWRDRFDAASDIVGRTVRANGVVHTVIGVMPPTFGFPIRESLWLPLRVDPLATRRGEGPSFQVVGRLRPGVGLTQARVEVAAIAAQLEREFPDTNRGIGADVLPYATLIFGPEIYGLLYTMLGAGIGVLLIACVNVSNLLVARASLRQREVAVRMALGAGRRRILRQHLTEVAVLATAGAGVGSLLSAFGMKWFTQQLTDPPPFWVTFELDSRVMLFVLGLIVAASLAAGLLPALYASRSSAGAALRDDSRSATSARLGRFSSGLVVAELAVSCGLLIAAGLMIKSVVQLKTMPMPFAIDNILTARIDLPRASYPDSPASIRFFEELLPRLEAVAGVDAAALSDGLPAAGNGLIPVQIEGQTYAHENESPTAREGIVTPGYFETFQTPVLSGREFLRSDVATSRSVAIINESFARAHYPNVDPIGRLFTRIRPGRQEPWLTIVGVVPDLIMEGIGNSSASPIGYYIPISQSDVANGVRMAVRTRGDRTAMTSRIRSAVTSLDPDLALFDVNTMQGVVDRQSWFYNVFGTFFTTFGVSALVLAAAGLYGVMAFSVTQRTREMGVRSALGAQGGQLILLVMRKSIAQLAIGLVLGLGLALAASGALAPVLYHVDPRDHLVFGLVVITLSATSLLATFLPARRVIKIDPARALAAE